MDYKSELRLFAVSLVADLILRFFFGDCPLADSLFAASATWLVFCALAGHGLRWLGGLSNDWHRLLRSIPAISLSQQYAANKLACGFLFYVYLPYELGVRLYDFKNIPNHPCLCGQTNPDGSRPTLREHCWNNSIVRNKRKRQGRKTR